MIARMAFDSGGEPSGLLTRALSDCALLEKRAPHMRQIKPLKAQALTLLASSCAKAMTEAAPGDPAREALESEALKHLSDAIKSGADPKQLRSMKSLEPLYESPGFKALLGAENGGD